MWILFRVVAWLALQSAAVAFAQAPPTTAAPPPASSLLPEASGFRGMAGGDLGFGRIGDAYYLRLNVGTELDFGKVGVGIQVPLNIRLTDRCGLFTGATPPLPCDQSYNSRLRKEDWDEPADYARLISYFRYGQPSDPLYVRAGQLHGATFGHGTVLNAYYNAINLDLYKLGVQINVNTDYGGVQTVMDNLFQPNLFGARVYVRPMSFFDKASYANNLAIGMTVLADAFAPVGTPPPTTSRSGHEPPLPTEAAVVLGVDVEFAVLRTKMLDVIPYTDFNHILGARGGWHLGVLTKVRPLDKLGLNFRLEYRYLSTQYVPGYFDSLYDIQRYTFPLGCTTTKFDYVRERNRQQACLVGLGGSGFYGEGVFSLFDLLTILITYEDTVGPNNSNLLLSVQLPAFDAVKFAAYYYKRYFDGLSNAFSLDNAVLVGEARIRMYSFMYFIARYARSWTLSADGTRFDSTDDFSVGIGFQARF